MSIFTLWVAACLLGGAALYFLLTKRDSAGSWVGAGLGGLSMIALWLAIATPVAWWGRLASESIASSPLFLLCGLAAIVFAGMTVTARRAADSVVWMLVTLLCVAALYLIHDAQFLAAGSILMAGGGTGTLMLSVARRLDSTTGETTTAECQDPFLACLCGCLLAIGLGSAAQQSFSAASVRDAERLPTIAARRLARQIRVSGHRPTTAANSRITQAGQSMFEDHWRATALLTVLLFVALVVALRLTCQPPRLEQTANINETVVEDIK